MWAAQRGGASQAKGSNPVATFERGKSKSPPNPLGLAERVPRPQAVEGVLGQWKAFIPIVFMPNILLFSDAQEAYEAYEAEEPIFLKEDRLFLI